MSGEAMPERYRAEGVNIVDTALPGQRSVVGIALGAEAARFCVRQMNAAHAAGIERALELLDGPVSVAPSPFSRAADLLPEHPLTGRPGMTLSLTSVRPSTAPVFALWVPEGGDDGQGSWAVDTTDSQDDDHPAVYFDIDHALEACRKAQADGIECTVVELRAVPAGGGW